MSTLSQIEKIEGLDKQQLDSLLKTILSKKDFTSIEILDDCLYALQKTLLNTSSAVFISFPFKLGGNCEVSPTEIVQKIKHIREKHAANSVFVYSNLTITKFHSNYLHWKRRACRFGGRSVSRILAP